MNYTINSKFSLGDTVYLVKTVQNIPCNACGEMGVEDVTLYSEDKTVKRIETIPCKECNGKGHIYTGKDIYVVDDDLYYIEEIRARLIKESIGILYSYTLKSSKTNTTTKYSKADAECSVFATMDEAHDACSRLNGEHNMVNIVDIKIKNLFRNSVPADYKIAQRIREYKENGKFSNKIILNKEGFLKDGYTQYLVCKMLDIPKVEVTVA